MGEEDEVKQGLGSKVANTAKEQGKEAVKKQGKKAVKKVASKFSKKFAQKAASASMKGPMMMLMLKLLVVILIIMAIIGIIMFVVAMPGMVMDKLKELFKAVGKGIASWFGGDQTRLNAEDTKIYEILTYLEQMGYDLKGEGFITDSYTADDVPSDKVGEWEADKENENTGVIRSKEDDSIVKADSLFVYNYLVSDNYVYTVKNFNMTTDDANGYQWWDAFQAIGGRFLNLFGNAGSEMWGRGLISLYHEDGEIGKRGDFYGNGIFHWNDIKVDANSKTLSIRRGWGSNKMVYSLDGWTGRYGMPLEFLLSIHLATKMPDLAYDMTKVFGGQNTDEKGTEVEILLHPLDGVSAISGYKKDYQSKSKETENSEYILYGEMKDIKGGNWFDGWILSKKEAFEIMSLGVKSPDNCTYLAPTFKLLDSSDNGDGWISDPDNLAKLKTYGVNDEDFSSIEADLSQLISEGTGEKFTVKEALQERTDEEGKMGTKGDSAEFYFYDYKTVNNNGGYVKEDGGWTAGLGTEEQKCDGKSHQKAKGGQKGWKPCGHTFYANGGDFPYFMQGTTDESSYHTKKTIVHRTWEGPVKEKDGTIKEDEGTTTYTWISYVYQVYKFPTKEREEGKGTYVASYIFDYIMRDLTTKELIAAGVLNEDGTAKEDKRCSDAAEKGSTEVTKCCENCRKHIKKMMSLMKDANDPDFDTYTPYISKVKNHWYRDVYFTTTGNQNFVQIDEEYEALMGERWTLYETDDNGQYVLYELNDDGTISDRKFNGTQQDANEKGVPVVKKAETIKITDTDANGDQLIDWVKNGNIWSAYKLNDQEVSSGWQPIYEGSEDELEKKMFYNITTKNDIVQVEEGQRTATNKDIRDMFLNNTYFRYDGSPETADTIDKLREKISGDELKYGHLSDSDLNKLSNEEKQYTGKVELTQDSLSAFSMLENTHTLDADFIYKDFKELVVELGYFTKEELSDETPRIFAWMIPEIGSYGYPIASLDKKENEYGTQAHSKEDYQANVKNTLAAAIAASVSGEQEEKNQLEGDKTSDVGDAPKGIEAITEEQKKVSELIGSIKAENNNESFISLGSIKSSKDLLSLEEWFEKLQEMFDIFKSETWTYAQDHSCSTFEQARTSGKHTTDCSLMASWALQMLGALEEGQTFSSHIATSSGLGADAVAQALLDAGAEVIPVGDYLDNFDKVQPGDILFYDEHVGIYCGEGYSNSNGETKVGYSWDTGSDTGIQNGGPRDCTYHLRGHGKDSKVLNCIVRFPLGNGGGSAAAYEGFEGGEAVVSPVTGILLEYGTYQKGEIDPVTEKESRVNVDFKYVANDEEEKADDDSGDPEPIQDVIDYVGYAKIMILDTETYLELENQMKGSAPKAIAGMKDREGNAIQSLVDKDGNYLENSALKSPDILTSDDASVKWSDKEISLYGYKEFAEMYSEFGVAGNIIFIDGFECELPVEGGEEEKTDDDKKDDTDTPKIFDGEDINKDYFERNANNDEFDKVLYEKEERYNLSSLDATNKLNNENDIKAEADSIIKVGDKLLIKEGTIIGRTMTNDEVMKKREENGIVTPTPKKETTVPPAGDAGKDAGDKEENTEPVEGNYLRIIMRDEDDTVVENVEEYMKLDEEGGGKSGSTLGNIEQFMYWQANEPEGFEFEIDGVKSFTLATYGGRRNNSSDKYGHDYAVHDGGNGDRNLCPGIWLDPGSSGRKIFEEVTGKTSIEMGTWCTGEQVLDIYTKELQVQIEEIKKNYPNLADYEEDDTRLFALIDVMYAGAANFKIGTIDDGINAGRELTKEDFLSNCTSENPFYTQNPNNFVRRRLCDWYMYSEGKYGYSVNDTEDISDIEKRYEFTSETPFQDLMVDKQGAEVVDM